MNMKTITQTKLNEILASHKIWTDSDGVHEVKATLNNVDLSNMDLSFAKLKYANLSGTDLMGVDLTCADLTDVNFK